jgi:hypothetical protein
LGEVVAQPASVAAASAPMASNRIFMRFSSGVQKFRDMASVPTPVEAIVLRGA